MNQYVITLSAIDPQLFVFSTWGVLVIWLVLWYGISRAHFRRMIESDALPSQAVRTFNRRFFRMFGAVFVFAIIIWALKEPIATSLFSN